jgi:hypothetical protein
MQVTERFNSVRLPLDVGAAMSLCDFLILTFLASCFRGTQQQVVVLEHEQMFSSCCVRYLSIAGVHHLHQRLTQKANIPICVTSPFLTTVCRLGG